MTTSKPIRMAYAALKLPPSMALEQVSDNTFLFTINRKSRIIMKDGLKLLEKVQQIRAQVPDARVEIKATAPICSKTRRFLLDEGLIVGPQIK